MQGRLCCNSSLPPLPARRLLQVRNIGRIGMKEYEGYLSDLHKSYPDYYVSLVVGWSSPRGQPKTANRVGQPVPVLVPPWPESPL